LGQLDVSGDCNTDYIHNYGRIETDTLIATNGITGSTINGVSISTNENGFNLSNFGGGGFVLYGEDGYTYNQYIASNKTYYWCINGSGVVMSLDNDGLNIQGRQFSSGAIYSSSISCSSLNSNNGTITAGSGVIYGGGLSITAGASVGQLTSNTITNAGLLQTGTLKGVHLPRYDSGWFYITNNSNKTLTHNLNIQMNSVPIHKLIACDTQPTGFSSSVNITDITGQGITYNNVVGHILKYYDSNTIQIYTGRDVIAVVEVVGSAYPNGASNFNNGYLRLFLY
jgi:hypothetical protein